MGIDIIQSFRKRISLIVRLSIAAFACWITFKDFDIKTLASLNVAALLLAIAVFCAALVLIAFRWWVFLRGQKIIVPYVLAIKLTFLGQFFTNFMPSSVGGDLVRAWYISRYTHKKIQAALGVIADRIMGLFATTILAVASYFLFMRGRFEIFESIMKDKGKTRSLFASHPISWPHVLVVISIIVGIFFLLNEFFDLNKAFRRLIRSMRHMFVQAREVLLIYVYHPSILFFGITITIVLQSAVIVSLWFIGKGLGMTVPLEYYFVFFPLMWVVSSLPLSIAGIGILEGGLVLLFVQFAGADENSARIVALCQRCVWVISSLPGLWIHLTGGHRHKEPVC